VNKQKFLKRILESQTNVRFSQLCVLVEAFGFRLDRITGSHHIYVHPEIPELLNLQSVKGQANPYQVRQFLALLEKYNLHLGDKS